jgi:hypothetical protein
MSPFGIDTSELTAITTYLVFGVKLLCGPSMMDYPETSRNLQKPLETGRRGFR